MPTTRLIAIGAIACDILLGVPYFPAEDSKLRATSFSKRRGGNVGNTLEVLQQLLSVATREDAVGDGRNAAREVQLTLVAALPARASPSTDFIASSFAASSAPVRYAGSPSMHRRSLPEVDMRHCLYRDGHDEPVTSYIISSEASLSRTIVNHNPLPEMTFDEFVKITYRILPAPSPGANGVDDQFWFHFEGRIPETSRQCMLHLREHAALRSDHEETARLTTSVELEKPGREGLQELAHLADVVFYSKSWAEGEGHKNPEECLRAQARILRKPSSADADAQAWSQQKLLICTWGPEGACGMQLDANIPENQAEDATVVVRSPAHKPESAPVVDTTGAGDTFIAGVLYQFLTADTLGFMLAPRMKQQSTLREELDYANALAGRKVVQHGFQGLA